MSVHGMALVAATALLCWYVVQQIAELEKLTLGDYIAWFDSFLLQPSGKVRKISVQVCGLQVVSY
jgi:hypothetical protein